MYNVTESTYLKRKIVSLNPLSLILIGIFYMFIYLTGSYIFISSSFILLLLFITGYKFSIQFLFIQILSMCIIYSSSILKAKLRKQAYHVKSILNNLIYNVFTIANLGLVSILSLIYVGSFFAYFYNNSLFKNSISKTLGKPEFEIVETYYENINNHKHFNILEEYDSQIVRNYLNVIFSPLRIVGFNPVESRKQTEKKNE